MKGREGKVVIRMIVLALIAVVANSYEAKVIKSDKSRQQRRIGP
jgi:hypothetical protein